MRKRIAVLFMVVALLVPATAGTALAATSSNPCPRCHDK